MKNNWKRTLAFLLISVLLIPAASAHSHPGDAAWSPAMSTWAVAEVNQAKELGLIPQSIAALENYKRAITRTQFRELAMNFVAVQEHADLAPFTGMVALYKGERDADGNWKAAFTDGSYEDSIAYYLGLVQGRGNGIFDPDGLLTRQEAAVMLTRAYGVIGGQLPAQGSELTFSDKASISDWATESAGALSGWKVINGMEDGRFAPQEKYSVEQCIVTLLRLFQNAPVSRKAGNVTQLFSYEQGMTYLDGVVNTSESKETLRVTGTNATLIRADWQIMMTSGSTLWLIHRDGGIQNLDVGLCTNNGILTPAAALENPAFSADGKTLTFTVTLPENIYGGEDSVLWHQKGTYTVTIDVDTGRYQAWGAPPQS